MSTNPSIRDNFGKPREGGGLNIISVGENQDKVVRILPPMKSLKEKGLWGAYHKQHYGYSVRDPRDPAKTRMRPFLCLEETDENNLTTTSCPECRKIEGVKQKMKDEISKEVERLRGQGIVGEAAEAQAMKSVEKLGEWLYAHNVDKKWYIPVMLEDNSFGFLKIPHAGKKAIDKARRKLLEDEKADIFDIDTGAWVKITRTGSGRATDYDATILREACVIDGRRVTIIKSAPLNDDQLGRALELPDATTLARRISIDQIRMLSNCGGSPAEVETILGLAQRSDDVQEAPKAVAVAKPAQTVSTVSVQTASTVSVQATKPTQVVAAVAVSQEDDDEARLEAMLAAAKAKKAAKAAAAPVVQIQQPLDELSDDEFLARFPPPQKQ